MGNRDHVLDALHPEPEIPFPPEEYATRHRQIRERMAAAGIDTLFLTAPESLYYVSGYRTEWYQAQSPPAWPATSGIAIHLDADGFIHFDTVREVVLTRLFSIADDVRIFPPDTMRDGTRYIADELAAAGWLRGSIGVERWSYRPNPVVAERFATAFAAAGATVVDGSAIVRELRFRKSPLEMAKIDEAARAAAIGMDAARQALAPGVTELEVYGEIVRALSAAGSEPTAIYMPVLSGAKTAAPHALATRRRMRAGELVMVDVSGVIDRYHANLCRTFSLGEPDPEVARIASLAAGGGDRARELLRPGLPVADLCRELRAYYEQAGIWDDRGWIGGYETGISFYGDWVGNYVWDPMDPATHDRALDAGTIVNHEMQFYLPGEHGHFMAIDSLIVAHDGTARVEPATGANLLVV